MKYTPYFHRVVSVKQSRLQQLCTGKCYIWRIVIICLKQFNVLSSEARFISGSLLYKGLPSCDEGLYCKRLRVLCTTEAALFKTILKTWYHWSSSGLCWEIHSRASFAPVTTPTPQTPQALHVDLFLQTPWSKYIIALCNWYAVLRHFQKSFKISGRPWCTGQMKPHNSLSRAGQLILNFVMLMLTYFECSTTDTMDNQWAKKQSHSLQKYKGIGFKRQFAFWATLWGVRRLHL